MQTPEKDSGHRCQALPSPLTSDVIENIQLLAHLEQKARIHEISTDVGTAPDSHGPTRTRDLAITESPNISRGIGIMPGRWLCLSGLP